MVFDQFATLVFERVRRTVRRGVSNAPAPVESAALSFDFGCFFAVCAFAPPCARRARKEREERYGDG